MKCVLLAAAVALVCAPVQARAEGYISPWGGMNFLASQDVDHGRGAVGINGGFMGHGILGAEVAFGYSPNFFGTSSEFGSNTVIDLMGNLVLGIPIGGTHGGGLRPYVSGGGGLIRTQIDQNNTISLHPLGVNNDFGWDAGGGVTGFVSNHFGLRGDIRFLADDDGPAHFHYWRWSAGIVIR
jgi:hypothetical protein